MLDVMNSAANTESEKPDWIPKDPLEKIGIEKSDNFWGGLPQFFEGIKDFFTKAGDFLINTPAKAQNWLQEKLGLSNVASSLNSANTQGKLAYTKSGIPYDSSNMDSRINAEMQEFAYKRDDESYDRLIAALKRNGINPAIALSNSASPMSSDSGYRSNFSLTDKDQVNSALKVGMIIALLMRVLK